MSASAFDNPMLAGLLGDDEIAPFLTADAELSEALAFERALLVAEAGRGHPGRHRQHGSSRIKAFRPDLANTQATARDGVIGVELVRQLRDGGRRAQRYSSCISARPARTSWTRRSFGGCGRCSRSFERRLGAWSPRYTISTPLRRRDAVMARTRMQDALPIAVATGWRVGAGRLSAHRRLDCAAPASARAAVRGAAGTLDKLGDKGPAVARRLAAAAGTRVAVRRLAFSARQHRGTRGLACSRDRLAWARSARTLA